MSFPRPKVFGSEKSRRPVLPQSSLPVLQSSARYNARQEWHTIAADAQSRIMTIEDMDDAAVELVWDPAWNQGMISIEGR